MRDAGIQKLVVVDVDTTGFGRHDRIVEIAALTLDPATWETVDEFDTLINPERFHTHSVGQGHDPAPAVIEVAVPEAVVLVRNQMHQVTGRASSFLQKRDIGFPGSTHFREFPPRFRSLGNVPANDPDHSSCGSRIHAGISRAPCKMRQTSICVSLST